MTAYAGNNLDAYVPPNCPRRDKPATFEWVDVTSGDDPVRMYVPGRDQCDTPGCVDERGYNSIHPFVEHPSVFTFGDVVLERYARGDWWRCRTCGEQGSPANGAALHSHPKPRRRWWKFGRAE